MSLETAALTDVGPARDHNEDAVRTSAEEGHPLLAVADGMGGHRAGDVASQKALDVFVEAVPLDVETGVEPTLREAVARANDHVRELAAENPEYDGMGTTLVAAVVAGGTTTVVNVGDSRAYHVTAESAEQVTVDQSLVRELVEQGTIHEDEAEDHPHSNVLLQALGTEESVEPDLYRVSLDGTLLLCSDGLSDVVPDEEIHEIVAAGTELDDVARRLVDRAVENGSTDNVSVVLARRDDDADE